MQQLINGVVVFTPFSSEGWFFLKFFGKISYGNMFTNLIDKYKDSCLVDLVRLIVCDSGASTNGVFCYWSSVVVNSIGTKATHKRGPDI